MERDKVVGICDLDTRALVRHIRQSGAMNAIICSDGTSEATLVEMLNAVPSMAGMELSSEVTCSEVYDAECWRLPTIQIRRWPNYCYKFID